MTFYSDLFTKLGTIVGAANEALKWQQAIGDQYMTLFSELFTPEELELYMPNIYNDWVQQANSISQTENLFVNYAINTLATQRAILGTTSTATSDLLKALQSKMTTDSASVNANEIGTPAISAITGTGTGVLIASKKNVAGIDDERIINEVVTFKCVRNAWFNGQSQWTMTGNPNYGSNSYLARGNNSGNINDTRLGQLITNYDFETWSSNTPSSWTVVGPTLIFDDIATNFYRGTNCLQIKSNATATTASITQTVNLQSNTIYCMSVRLKKDSTLDGTSALRIGVAQGGVALTDLFASANPTTLTNAWVLYNVFFALPNVLTSSTFTFYAQLTAANTITSGKAIYIDDMMISTATMFGNVAYAIIPGSTEFAIGDTFTSTTVNDYKGVFQTYFGRYFNTQLPSKSDGSETIDDVLAAEVPPTGGSGW